MAQPIRLIGRALLSILVCGTLVASWFALSRAQNALIVVRAYYDRPQRVAELARWKEPWEVNREEGYVVVGVDPAEIPRLEQLGFRVEIDQDLTRRVNQRAERLPGQTRGMAGYPCYRTLEEIYATAQGLAAAHPELAAWVDIGDTWDKITLGDPAGFDMMALRLTNTAIPGPKPALFAMATIHAREYIPGELLTRFAEYLVNGYGSDAEATWLLDYHEIHLVLQANPDGRKIAQGPWPDRRKNTDQNYCSWNWTQSGADLNRNFPFQWNCCGGSSPNECEDTYHGASAASEPETQAIRDYLLAHFADQREAALGAPAPETASGVFLDVHSYGEWVLWPWGFTDDLPPNAGALQTLGRKMAYFNSYFPKQGIDLYPTDGSTDDYAYGELGLAAYTLELGIWFDEECSVFEQTILPANLPVLLYAARVAAAPYRQPAGPDAYNLSAQSSGTLAAQKLRITATVDDTRYSARNGTQATQNIAAAQVFLDTPPWITTTVPISRSMTAVDGVFDQKIESVTAAFDAPELSSGRHTLFVRGQDAAGNWGPVSALFVDVALYNQAIFLPLVAR